MRARWIAVGIAALAAAILAAWLLRSGRGAADSQAGSDPAGSDALDPAKAKGLAKGAGRRKPGLPANAVEIEVVAREGGTPVEGVSLRLRRFLGRPGEPVSDAALAMTDANGRARLADYVPGFLEVVDASWTAPDGVASVEGGKAYRVEVTPRVAYSAVLRDEKTGLPLAGWVVSPSGPAHEPSKTDGLGAAGFPFQRGPPNMIAAWDGAKRIHTFFLYSVESRTEIKLRVPAATRTTRLRAVDPEGHPVADARAYLIEERTGIALDFDARGELDVEYASSGSLSLVVAAPGRSRHPLSLDGEPVLNVVLEATTKRVFRLVRADGRAVADGTRLVGDAGGPASYGQQSWSMPIAGTSERGLVAVDGLPAGEFSSHVEAAGPGLLAMATVSAPADPAVPIDVPVGAPRPFTFRVLRPGDLGADAVPAAGPLWLRVVEPSGCRSAGGFADLLDDVRTGQSQPGKLWQSPGADAKVDVPSSDRAIGVEIGARGEGYACLRIQPDDAGGAKTVLLAPAEDAEKRSLTPMQLVFADGSSAALQQYAIRRDESGAPARRGGTDSAGTGYLFETSGRFVLEATTNDGAKWESDGPILLPSQGPIVVRLRPVSR